MPKFVSIIRLRKALAALASWRECVDKQGAQHLLTFLALKESGANTSRHVAHTEQADKAFCERYLQVRPGDKPFYDPILGDFRIHTHYHSNMATLRKGTFQSSWNAGSVQGTRDSEEWILSSEYLSIIADKIFTKARRLTKMPVVDLACWLFRNESFPEDATIQSIIELFKSRFRISDEEFTSLFSTDNLDGSRPSTSGAFATYPVDESLLLELLDDPLTFDLSEAIIEIADQKGLAPVTETDLLSLISTGHRNLILQGSPGTGKTRAATRLFGLHSGIISESTPDADLSEYHLSPDPEATHPYLAESGGWTLVQFHPTYSYDDFVQGISATIDPETGTPAFEVRDGVFLEVCRLAATTDKLVFLIIDEVNRGDLSKIFGELIYALEYRDKPVNLRAAAQKSTCLTVPNNLVVIGTMNSADRSIAHIDYAIRRRFTFVTLVPDRSAIAAYYGDNPLAAAALKLFEAATGLVGANAAHAIGHSFFLANNADDLANRFVFQVLPLMDEYRREGLLDEAASIELGEDWPGESLPIYHDRPFSLAQELSTWISGQCSS